MKFIQHYSGSAGNFYEIVSVSGKRLLIDPGIKWKKIQRALSYDLSKIEACLCDHEHSDHSISIKDVLRAGIDVYASEGTLEETGVFYQRRSRVVSDKSLVRLPSFEVFCFDVNHDAKEPLGFIVREKDTNEYLLFATDTSHIVQRFVYPFSIIAIECSYSKEILRDRVDRQDINEALAKRLLTSHMEKDTAKKYIQDFCDLSKCREIHLLHMSGDNLNKSETRKEFESEFFIKTIVAEIHGCLCTKVQ